ncbi:MAG: radical SAM/SPASM domain-containing protein, partial [bacterium]
MSQGIRLSEHQGIRLDWVDGFIREIKPFIYVREIDNLLILIPNQAYRLNHSGVAILNFLLKGNSITKILEMLGDDEKKREELHYFFCDLRAIVSGCFVEGEKREAVSYYEFKDDLNDYPVLSEIAVTYRCNLNCEFCYVGHKKYPELNTSDLKKIIFKIYKEANVPSVSFTGGEPLLRDDIVSLVEYAHNTGLWTNLITNGTLLNRNLVRSLKKAGLNSAQVSLEGPNCEIHDKITNVKGSFEKTITGIKYLIEENIPVHTNTTVSRHNINCLEGILLLAKSIGLKRLSTNLVIPCGSAENKKDLWIPYSEIGAHILKLKHLAEKENIKFLWYSPVPMCEFNPIAYGLGNKSCAAITGLLSIDPMGNILPCSSWREPVGSLLKKGFKEIWNSAMLSYFKNADYAPEGCHKCSEFKICKGACPLFWKALSKYKNNVGGVSNADINPNVGGVSNADINPNVGGVSNADINPNVGGVSNADNRSRLGNRSCRIGVKGETWNVKRIKQRNLRLTKPSNGTHFATAQRQTIFQGLLSRLGSRSYRE